MAKPINFTDLQNQRGLDPRAIKALELREKKKEEQAQRLKQDKVQREVNSLHSRLAIINREIERLTVTERRSRGSITGGEKELARDLRDVAAVSKELIEHEGKIKELRQMMGKETNFISRLRNQTSVVSHSMDSSKLSQLRVELNDIQREKDQLENKRRRIIGEMAQEQAILERKSEQKKDSSNGLREHESKVQQILQEMHAEQGTYNRLKAHLSSEQQKVRTETEAFERDQRRMEGSSKGTSSLERDKKKMENRIRELEREMQNIG